MKKVLSILLAVFMVMQLFTFSVLAEEATVSDSVFTGQVLAVSNTANRAKVVYGFLSSLSSGAKPSYPNSIYANNGISEDALNSAYAKFSDTGRSLASQVISFASGFPGVAEAFEAQKAIYGTNQSSPYMASGLNNFTKMLIISREFFGSPVFARAGDEVYVYNSGFNNMYNTTNAFLELNDMGSLNEASYKSSAQSIASSISAMETGEKAIITSLLSSFSLYSGSAYSFEEFASVENIDEELEEVDVETSEDPAEEVSETVANSLSDVTAAIEEAQETGATTQLLDSIVDEVIEKASRKLAKVVETAATENEEGEKETNTDLTDDEDGVEDVISQAKDLKDSLDKKLVGSTSKEVQAKAIISTKSGDSDVKSANVKISANNLNSANTKNVKLELETDVSSLEMEPGTIETETEDESGNKSVVKSISFKAQRIEETDLSDDEKEKIGNSSVFDFSIIASKDTLDSDGNVTETKEEKLKNEDYKKPLKVKIPYTLKPGETKDNITVFFLNDETGELEENNPLKTSYNTETGILTVTLDHFSRYVIKSNVKTFDDITTQNWSKRYIESMAAKGVTKGTGGNQFSPLETLTKAEYVTMLARLLGIDNTNATNDFLDVEEDTWYYSAISAAVEYDILLDDGDYFRPNTPITRQEMAAITGKALTNVLGYKVNYNSTYLDQFTDGYLVRGSYNDYVSLTVKKTVMEGIPVEDGLMFAPNRFTTREMAIKVMYELFNLE